MHAVAHLEKMKLKTVLKICNIRSDLFHSSCRETTVPSRLSHHRTCGCPRHSSQPHPPHPPHTHPLHGGRHMGGGQAHGGEGRGVSSYPALIYSRGGRLLSPAAGVDEGKLGMCMTRVCGGRGHCVVAWLATCTGQPYMRLVETVCMYAFLASCTHNCRWRTNLPYVSVSGKTNSPFVRVGLSEAARRQIYKDRKSTVAQALLAYPATNTTHLVVFPSNLCLQDG